MTTRFWWALAAAVAFGLAAGLGAFTFVYAKGASYLSTDPAACANCHIMGEHYAAWAKSSHRSVAGCADCHMPHEFVGKWAAKASNGFWHSLAFTTGRFPDPLQIKPHNRAITEHACRDCHQPIVDAIDAGSRGVEAEGEGGVARPAVHDGTVIAGAGELSCIRCHTYVGHLVR
ncbi:MAG TPA: cytochrome c nitrite reductase small subunit [Gemmatimonadaceae bacterium]